MRLRDVKAGRLPREAEWPEWTAALSRDPPEGWSGGVLGDGRGLILIDGLDELASEARDVARDTLRNILKDKRGNLVVVTSRPGAVDSSWFEGLTVEQATISPMTPDQRATCIENWHEAVARAKPADREVIVKLGADLTQKIRITSYLREPTTNPLVCAATCALHYGRRGYLPAGLVDLFNALCAMMIHQRDEEQGLIEQANVPADYRALDLGHKRLILEEVASEMVINQKSQRAQKDVEPLVKEVLRGTPEHRNLKPEKVLEGLLLRSGILRAAGEDTVDFLHNAFKEYLAASRFLVLRRLPYLIDKADHDPGDRVFVYAYAIASAAGDQELTRDLVNGLLNKPCKDPEVWRARAFLALRCRAITVRAAPEVLDRFDQLIDDVLPPQTLEEGAAIAALGDFIVDRLRWPDAPPEIAAACTSALVTIGTPQAFTALEVYRDTEHQTVAEQLAQAIEPLELPFWRAWLKKGEYALPDGVARQITDLSPLSGLTNLKRLALAGTQVSDLGLLSGLSSLQHLDLTDTQVKDLRPLSRLSSLQSLDVSGTQATDLGPLSGLRSLQCLTLTGTQVKDLRPLSGLRSLQSLDLAHTQVSDLRPLSGLRSLQYLNLQGAQVSDLGPLAAPSSLQYLNLSGTQVNDLQPLSGLSSLQYLDLTRTQVSDLCPLSGMSNLEGLLLIGTPVTDLEPLKDVQGLKVLGAEEAARATAPDGIEFVRMLTITLPVRSWNAPLASVSRMKKPQSRSP